MEYWNNGVMEWVSPFFQYSNPPFLHSSILPIFQYSIFPIPLKIDLKFFSNQLLKSELLRSASVLVTGTVIAQLISILLQPFLRRFFLPQTFGTYSVYLSVVGIIAVVASLRYDDAIVLPKKDKESANVLFLSVISNFIINLLIFLIILIWGKKFITLLNIPTSFPISILYLIPLSVFLVNTYQSFNYWLIRKKRYYSVSLNKLIRRVSEGISQISFALIKNPKGLIFSDIIGQSANVITTIIQGFKYGFSCKSISISKLKYVLKKYSDFPKYNLIPALMSTCSYFLPPIFINKFFSAENTGYFDLSKLLLSIPLALVASSLSNVLLQRIAEKFGKRDSFVNELKPVLYVVTAICITELLVILLFGIGIFKFAFGDNWGISGEISKIMVWSFAFNFFVSSFSCVFISMQKIKTYSVWQFFYFLSILSLLFFKNLTFIDFLKVYVLIEVVCYFVLTVIIVYIITRYELSLKKI
jgi:O-antigen/teichoic acid export membrane protein